MQNYMNSTCRTLKVLQILKTNIYVEKDFNSQIITYKIQAPFRHPCMYLCHPMKQLRITAKKCQSTFKQW